MIIDSVLGPVPLKMGKELEVRTRGEDEFSPAGESVPEEDKFSSLLAKAVLLDESSKADDDKVVPTGELPPAGALLPAPVQFHAVHFASLPIESPLLPHSAASSQDSNGSGSNDLLAFATVDARHNALSDDILSAPLAHQGAHLGLDKSATKFVPVEFELMTESSPWIQDVANIKSTVSMGAFDAGDRAPKMQEEAPTAKLTDHPFQMLELGSDASLASGKGVEIGMATGVDAFPQVEKSSFWTASGIHNLALKLDGQGDAPIEIKISLSGLDAQVDIRTDHAALRQMIEGSVQAIKDQLHGEGLSLSAVSVGTGFQGRNPEQTPDEKNRTAPDNPYLKDKTLDCPSPVRLPSAMAGRKLSVFV